MDTNNDSLTICRRCNSNACYEFQQPQLTTWLCMGCGFTTNSEYTFSNKKFKIVDVESSLPELIKDLRFVDEKGYVWYPTVINQNGKGMVFPDGNNKDNWKWSAVKSIEVNDSEKEKYKNPKGGYYKFKSDMESLKQFEQLDFMDGLEYIGYFS